MLIRMKTNSGCSITFAGRVIVREISGPHADVQLAGRHPVGAT
jgi:hypothetical protein